MEFKPNFIVTLVMILLDKYADPFPIKWTNIKRRVSNLICLIRFFGWVFEKKKETRSTMYCWWCDDIVINDVEAIYSICVYMGGGGNISTTNTFSSCENNTKGTITLVVTCTVCAINKIVLITEMIQRLTGSAV